MPFTFSHPAIVLPLTLLRRKWISVTGLVAGSIAPDFEYFIRLKIRSEYSHTLLGIFYFGLPLSMLLTFLFHCIARDPLINNLPSFLNQRLYTFCSFDWSDHFRKNIRGVLASLLVGIGSHLLWDSFTHNNGLLVMHIPVLSTEVSLNSLAIPLYKLLQHLSSVGGMLAIVLVMIRLPTGNVPAYLTGNRRSYWTVFFLCTKILPVLFYYTGYSFGLNGHLVAASISILCLSLLLTPIFLILYKKCIN